MVGAFGCVLQGRENVFALQPWVISQDLLVRFASRKKLQDILYTNAHPPNAGASAALIQIDRDTDEEISLHTL